jgi:beta-galactosidase/beta-glucuronidase
MSSPKNEMTFNRDVAYPRPDFDRSHCWSSLNGIWDFRADPDNQGQAAHWEQVEHGDWLEQIVVPFCWETPASHIAHAWLPVGWYRRQIDRPAAWTEARTILHFGAVHYHCQVWLNGQWVGEHTGGYLPFSLDITNQLENGAGDLVVRVEAPLDKLAIPHGKQRSRPADDYDSCAFTASSGIWQSVWLEARPATYIEQVQLRPTADLTALQALITLNGPHLAEATLQLQVAGEAEQIFPAKGQRSLVVTLPIEQPQRWSPLNPHLYTVLVRLSSADGEDRVSSYTGLRKVEIQGNRILLNSERLYLRGALDQGYWSESGYTAPNETALRRDVELALKAGYNLIRKHIKLEDPRWLYWADVLGLLVWEEPPCTGRYSRAAIERFEAQLAPMVARDGNHPSVIMWGIYNEEWGLDWDTAQSQEKQNAVRHSYDLLASLDKSRPIIDDSGWNHVKTDILDWHYYDSDIRRWNEVTAAIANDATTWFGHQLAVDNCYETQLSLPESDHAHTGLPLLNGEYCGGDGDVERGWHLRWQTQALRRHDAMSGYIYTELYDVEHELCGIYTAERQLRALGCDPADVNAETVVIFDLIPERPGLDYRTQDRAVDVTILLSHQGPEALRGKLTWGWEDSAASQVCQAMEIAPFTITQPISIYHVLPNGWQEGRLAVRFIDDSDRCRAYEFLDVAMATANIPVVSPRARATTTEETESVSA